MSNLNKKIYAKIDAWRNRRIEDEYVSIFCAWDTARKAPGLPEVRVHDLRHGFASFLINAGRSLYEVQKLLGHTQIRTTQRHAHLSQDTLQTAANAAVDAADIEFRRHFRHCRSRSNRPLYPRIAELRASDCSREA